MKKKHIVDKQGFHNWPSKTTEAGLRFGNRKIKRESLFRKVTERSKTMCENRTKMDPKPEKQVNGKRGLRKQAGIVSTEA